MIDSQKLKQPEDYRGRLVRYLVTGDYGMVVEKSWAGPYLVVAMAISGRKIVVSIGDEHSLVELI